MSQVKKGGQETTLANVLGLDCKKAGGARAEGIVVRVMLTRLVVQCQFSHLENRIMFLA